MVTDSLIQAMCDSAAVNGAVVVNSANIPGIISSVSEILSATAWPIAVLLIFFVFRKELSLLLSGIKEFKWGDKAIGWRDFPGGEGKSSQNSSQPLADSATRSAEAAVVPNSGRGNPESNFSMPANLYWFGYDMMQTFDWLLRGAPHHLIVRGLRQSHHHLNELTRQVTELANYRSRLEKLKVRAESSLQSDWTPQLRQDYAEAIGDISANVGKIFEQRQPGVSLWAQENRPG